MPPERQPAQNRRRLPFKPPSRASTSATASTTAGPSKPKPKPKTTTKKTPKVNATASSSKTKLVSNPSKSAASTTRKQPSPTRSSNSSASPSGSGSDSDSSSDSRNHTSNDLGGEASEANYILAEISHADNPTADDVLSSDPVIPPKLLTKLIHHHFRNEKTKIAKDANAVVAKYIDVYVREAVARAAFERAEGDGGGGHGVGFLEVEDLEKMGPQLAMDF
ncbi:CENP-S associating centromere protein X-domain-containing protein [Aspergillus californicus]